MTHSTIYVSCAESRDIHVFSLDHCSGKVVLRQRMATPGLALPMRIRPDRHLLYVGTRSENVLLAYGVDPASGTLSLIGNIPAPGGPTYVSSDREQRVVFCASYRDNSLAVFPLDAQGAPQAASQVILDLPRAHCALMDASNRWLLVPLLGADAIACYRLGEDLHLTPNDPERTSVRAGSGPRHLVFSADNRQVYSLNELDGQIDLFDFDSARGRLTLKHSVSLLPPGFSEQPWAAELRLAPDGRFLYATERRSSTLAAFAVDRANGQLSLLGHYPTETQPRGMAVDPSGLWLVAAGELSGHLTLYALDPKSGIPSPRQRHATGPNPVCVEIAATRPDN